MQLLDLIERRKTFETTLPDRSVFTEVKGLCTLKRKEKDGVRNYVLESGERRHPLHLEFARSMRQDQKQPLLLSFKESHSAEILGQAIERTKHRARANPYYSDDFQKMNHRVRNRVFNFIEAVTARFPSQDTEKGKKYTIKGLCTIEELPDPAGTEFGHLYRLESYVPPDCRIPWQRQAHLDVLLKTRPWGQQWFYINDPHKTVKENLNKPLEILDVRKIADALAAFDQRVHDRHLGL